jgi:hypothetical protein
MGERRGGFVLEFPGIQLSTFNFQLFLITSLLNATIYQTFIGH